MKFDLKSPCSNCPFRKDTLKGWLSSPRAKEIWDSVAFQDGLFPCHKTTQTIETDDESENIATENSQHCAGALILLEKENATRNNFLLRIAFGISKSLKLDELKNQELVFDSAEDFIIHHGANYETFC